MPVCSYLVIPEKGAGDALLRTMKALPGCDVTRALNRDVLLVVTDTPSSEVDRQLRNSLEQLAGIHALVLTFGEIDPDTDAADPLADRRRKGSRHLPIVDPGGLRPTTPSHGDDDR